MMLQSLDTHHDALYLDIIGYVTILSRDTKGKQQSPTERK